MNFKRFVLAVLIVILIICCFYLFSKLQSIVNEDFPINQYGHFRIVPTIDIFNQDNDGLILRRHDNIEPALPIRITVLRRTYQNNRNVEPPVKIKTEPEKYYDQIQQHDNDSQNVHNSQVISLLTKKYNKLLELNEQNIDREQFDELIRAGMTLDDIHQSQIEESFKQIRDLVGNKMSTDDLKRKKICKVLDEISKGNTITSISTNSDENGLIPIHENWILTLVWRRIHHDDNKNNLKDLEDMLLNQLTDCIQETGDAIDVIMQALFPTPRAADDPEELSDTYLVCINGRVARVLSSLSLLDVNSLLAEPERDEKEMANIAYMKSSVILKNALQKQNIEELYIKDEEQLTVEEKNKLEDFQKHVKDEIESTLLKEYHHIIPIKKLNSIIQKAQAGV